MTAKEEAAVAQDSCKTFVDRARTAAAIVTEIKTFNEAVDYAIKLCEDRELSRIPISDDERADSDGEIKTIAAPALASEEYEMLEKQCSAKGFDCIDSGMRDRLRGVDIGFTYADIGIAETGTVVVNCPGEELRLATMLCEYHVCIVPKSKIVKDGFAAELQLQKFMLNTPNYTAFITGPSRTADIERVLAIGGAWPLGVTCFIAGGLMMQDAKNLKEYRQNCREALGNDYLRETLDKFAVTYRASRDKAFADFDVNQLIADVASMKDDTLRQLDTYYEQFKQNAEASGVIVHYAKDADEANEIICRIGVEAGLQESD